MSKIYTDDDNLSIGNTEEQKDNSTPWLDEYKFKPGQSGNPGGRPAGKSITAELRKLIDEGNTAEGQRANYAKCRVVRERYRKANMEKCRAQVYAGRAFPDREVCSVEGCISIGERHHPDYNKPYEIDWLCRKHHRVLCHNL